MGGGRPVPFARAPICDPAVAAWGPLNCAGVRIASVRSYSAWRVRTRRIEAHATHLQSTRVSTQCLLGSGTTPKFRCRCLAGGEPGPGADVGRGAPTFSRARCGGGTPFPGADIGRGEPSRRASADAVRAAPFVAVQRRPTDLGSSPRPRSQASLCAPAPSAACSSKSRTAAIR